MNESMPELIETIKNAIPLVARTELCSNGYLEGVLARENLERCVHLLNSILGPPAKPFGKETRLDSSIEELINQIGGIRRDQCLFIKQLQAQQLAYAMLWPWSSDTQSVTLKVGTLGAL